MKNFIPYALCSMRVKFVALPHALCPMRFFVFVRYALCAMLILLVLMLSAEGVRAQGILQGLSGYSETEYDFFTTKSKDASGNVTKTTTNSLTERLNLNINTNIFPNLKLNAGGLFEKDLTWTKGGDTDIKSTTTLLRPIVELILTTPLYTAGVGYNRKEETDKSSGVPGITTISEEYRAILGWKPVGFPMFNVLFTRTNFFDEKRISENTSTDLITLNSWYNYRGVDIRYAATYNDTKDKLTGLETENLTQNGRLSYSNSFFNNRVSLNTIYTITNEQIKTFSKGTGEVSLQLFPLAGLSSINDMPTTGALDPNPALIDGNLTTSAGINIGLPPLGGDTRPRNMGLDFVNVVEVNELFVWVNRELPQNISSAFSWDIYTSPDNLNWSKIATVSSAPFGPSQNRFDINFPGVNTRFIKVVTNPLSPAVLNSSTFPNIFVTELQAFTQTPVQVVGTTSQTLTSHLFNLDSRTRIFDSPTLFYELSYLFTRTDPSAQQRWILSNGLSLDYRLSNIFSTSARVTRQDDEQKGTGDTVRYIYNASITATPVRTLRNSLLFSGQIEEVGKKSTDLNSIFLNNNAALYKGIDVNLNGGVSFSKNETGQDLRNTLINFGANITPNRALVLNLNYSDSTTNQSGGGQPSSSTYSRRGDVRLTYIPFSTLNLFASAGVLMRSGQKIETLQSYGINWAPFPDGTIQFNFAYNENFDSLNNIRERTIIPSLIWKITNRVLLQVSYQMISSSSKTGSIDTNGASANLKIFY